MTDDAAAAGALTRDHDASLAQSPDAAAAAAAAAADQSFTSQDDDTLLSSSSLTLACEKHPKGKRKRTAYVDPSTPPPPPLAPIPHDATQRRILDTNPNCSHVAPRTRQSSKRPTSPIRNPTSRRVSRLLNASRSMRRKSRYERRLCISTWSGSCSWRGSRFIDLVPEPSAKRQTKVAPAFSPGNRGLEIQRPEPLLLRPGNLDPELPRL